MTIRRKDGSPYSLTRPNPLGINQEDWVLGNSEIVLHNCKWEDELQIDDLPEPQPVQSDFKVEKLQMVEDPVVPPVVTKPNPIEPPKAIIPKAVADKIVMFWCLPTITQAVEDDLYGDAHYRQSYGKKFSFEGVILLSNDLELKFWTTAPQIEIGSIVFPSKYTKNNEAFGDFRWWKVQSVVPKEQGAIMNCVASDVTPDFSA